MKLFSPLSFLIPFVLFSCLSKEPDNTKPMYGEIEKSEEHFRYDEEFKKESIRQFVTIENAISKYADLGWKYFYNNDLATSMKRFNQAWLLNPEHPDSYFGFAALLEMQKNKAEAERFYKMGLERDKNKERAELCYQRIADCKEKLKDIEGTKEAYRRISELNSSNSFAFKKIGYFAMDLGNQEEALDAYHKAIELDSNDLVTYNNRGYLYQQQQKFSLAIADYTRVVELDPDYVTAYINRGVCRMQLEDYQGAKEDFEVGVELNPDAGEFRRFLGLAKVSLKDESGACQDFIMARVLGDKGAEADFMKYCK